jgi:hydrogenase-4 component E
MATLLIIIFIITLFYAAISGRMFALINLLMLQGFLLFGVALIELREMNVINLIVILVETLVFKAFIVPYFLKRTIRLNNIKREVEPYISGINSLIIVSILIILSFILTFSLQQNFHKVIYFTVAFSAILTGLFLMVSRKKIITHIIGYIILENGIVLLSFSVGNEMPMIVNAGILLDILVSVLLFGFFLSKIRYISKDFEISSLSKLKD